MASRKPKYAHVVENLPRLPGGDPDRQVAIDATRAAILRPRVDAPGTPQHEPPWLDENRLNEVDRELADAEHSVEHALHHATRLASGRQHAAVLAQGYALARKIKDALGDLESSAQLLIDAYEGLMVAQMEVEGVASMRLIDGSSVSTYQEPYPKVVDKELFRVWCIQQGLEKEMHLWPSRTAKLVKEMLLGGEAEPPGVETYAKTMVRLNKA